MNKPNELLFMDKVSELVALRQYEPAISILLSGLKKIVCAPESRISAEQFEFFFERSAAVYLIRNELSSGEAKTKAACSFCGKGEEAVERMIGGAGVFICSGCVAICIEVISTASGSEG